MPMIYAIFRGHPRVHDFTPQRVVQILSQHFPEATIDNEDALQQSADFAKHRIEGESNPTPEMKAVVQKLQQYAIETGPAFPFEIATEDETSIKGVAKRFMIDFTCEKAFSTIIKSRIRSFFADVFAGATDIHIIET